MKTCLVITTINPPSTPWLEISRRAKEVGWDFAVIGDVKSPLSLSEYGNSYFDIKQQEGFFPSFAAVLPKNHYARKNIGYLIARARGAEVIVETDDDNFPRDESFFSPRSDTMIARKISKSDSGWINPYIYFTQEKCWPRGFPLEEVNGSYSPAPTYESDVEHAYIQQGLADKNPDVDAIFRMTSNLPLNFETELPLQIPNGSATPFNSQNTTIFKKAFPLLYLPSHVSFRMTDIWRSFVALRLMHEYRWSLVYTRATVYQDRNEHNLLKDFEGEVPGYLNNTRIWSALMSLQLHGGEGDILHHLIQCYLRLVELGVVPEAEISLLEAWVKEFDK